MSDWDLLFRGTKLVSEQGVIVSDLAVIGEKIATVGTDLTGEAKEIIELPGAYLFPAIIDAHIHFNEPGRTHWEGIETGSRALAAGGGGTFFDMPLNAAPPTLDRKSFAEKLACAEKKSVLDFALWGGLTPANLDQMDELADAGVIGFKAFMSESGTADFRRADAATLKRGMEIAARWKLPVGVHAEDNTMIEALVRKKRSAGGKSWRDYLESRPVEAELAAIRVALDLAGETGCVLHVVHVSCAEGIEMISAAKKKGVNVTAETCPHYLLLTDRDAGSIGAPAKCAPPLRSAKTQEALWGSWLEGEIDTLGSDHSPAPPDMKTASDFFDIWGGIAGCQHAFALAIGESERRAGETGLSRFARSTSAKVAQRFGLDSTKGKIAPGYDADLIVVTPGCDQPIRRSDLLYRHPISPYLEKRLTSTVTQTWVRGRAVYRDGRIQKGRPGKFLKPETR
jgi:allantoinase